MTNLEQVEQEAKRQGAVPGAEEDFGWVEGDIGEIVTLEDGRRVQIGTDGDNHLLPAKTTEDRMLSLELDFAEALGIELAAPDDQLRLSKGQGVRLQLLSEAKHLRLCEHALVGRTRITCPNKTSPELLEQSDHGRGCPLCDAKVPLRFRRFLLAAVVAKSPLWKAEAKPKVKIWPLTEAAWEQFDKLFRAGHGQVIKVERQDNEYGTYRLSASDCEPVALKEMAPPRMTARTLWNEKALAKLAETWVNTDGLQPYPEPGRVETWRKILPGALLVPLIWGTKKPARSEFLDEENVRRWMADQKYLTEMDESQGIAMLNTGPCKIIDIDSTQEAVAAFVAKNPWTKGARWNKGQRGRRYIVRMKDDAYPHIVIHVTDSAGEPVGEFRGAESSTIDNLHPAGMLYEQHEGAVPTLAYTDIKWPEGWVVESVKTRKAVDDFIRGYAGDTEGGILDLSLLENVREEGDHVRARCPACAEENSDKTGNHLIIYDGGEGPYGCAAHQDEEHYRRIFELAMKPQFQRRAKARSKVEKLATLDDPIEAAIEAKAAAEDLGVPQAAVNAAVRQAKARLEATEKEKALGLGEVEPWPQAVNGSELLYALGSAYARFLAVSDYALAVLPVYSLHTYCWEEFNYAPILQVTSPDRACGKSRLLEVASTVVCKPLAAANASAAAVFRAVERWRPCLVLDEWDSQGDDLREALRNILNSGWQRHGGAVLRCDGDNNEPRLFSTYSPKIVAGIGELPDTAASRAIRINVERRLKSEAIEPFRHFDGTDLRRKCARWVLDNAEAIRAEAARAGGPGYMPDCLSDRQANVWEPLFVLARVIGGDWPKLLWDAAVALCEQPVERSLQAELLSDIQSIFLRECAEGRDRIKTTDLLNDLNLMADRPWPTLSNGKPMTEERMARLLRLFGIRAVKHRFGAGRSAPRYRGYRFEAFSDAFVRYLPALTPAQQAEVAADKPETAGEEDNP
jgi:hypothetical protein